MLIITQLNHRLQQSLSIALASALSLGTILTGVAIEPAHSKTAAPAAPAKASGSIWDQLKLDANQKKSLQAIRTKRTKAISEVLNKDQKAKFDQLRGKQRLGEILPQLKLDSKQKDKISQINQRTQKEILNVLKPEQKKQLNDYLKRTKQSAE